jgi:AraC-like DNA-binding protein
MNDNQQLIEHLTHSHLYQDYERAFSDATGLPVSLRPVESWQLPLHGRRKENAFCALMARTSRSCAACLQTQQEVADRATHQPCAVDCAMGLCDVAVPVRTGDTLVGYLQTGQVFRRQPTNAQFERAVRQMEAWGVPFDREEMRAAYFSGRTLSQTELAAIMQMLHIFAQHLGIVTNQLLVQQEQAEPPVITRAKAYITEHQEEDLSLGRVAKAVNTSTFYFCKLFKKTTGINFTEYVSRVRIERAKELLLNPNLRISEIAYEVGFQSLTHFNRVFKKLLGQSPTQYRSQMPAFA